MGGLKKTIKKMISLYQWPLNSKTCQVLYNWFQIFQRLLENRNLNYLCLGVAETVAGLVSFERWCGVSNGHQIHLQHQETG